MSVLEFEKLYPERKQPGVGDYFVYESRKIPFSVSGGQAVSKIFQFKSSNHISSFSAPFTVDIILEATTMESEQFRSLERENENRYFSSEKDVKIINEGKEHRWVSRLLKK